MFRFLNGFGYGIVLSAVSVYIVEIATTDMRGFLGCFVQFQVKQVFYGSRGYSKIKMYPHTEHAKKVPFLFANRMAIFQNFS